MCDTVIIPASFTQQGNTLFAKNSDREPGEAQPLLHVPRTRTESSTVRCTYIDIPQVAQVLRYLGNSVLNVCIGSKTLSNVMPNAPL